jgi:hypothetical protein
MPIDYTVMVEEPEIIAVTASPEAAAEPAIPRLLPGWTTCGSLLLGNVVPEPVSAGRAASAANQAHSERRESTGSTRTAR